MLIPHQKPTPKYGDVLKGWINYLIRNPDIGYLRKYIPYKKLSWTSSGRSALYQILKKNKIKKVAFPAFTCKVVLDAIIKARCKFAFIDSDGINYDKLIKADAIIWPYNFGFLPNIERIKKFCKENNIIFIEDCAQALGATFKGKLAGTFGDFSFYSFGISKNIGFCNGMVVGIDVDNKKKYPAMKTVKNVFQAKVNGLFFNPYIYSISHKLLQRELIKEHDDLDFKASGFGKYIVMQQAKRYDKILRLRKENAEYCMKGLDGIINFIKPIKYSEPAWLYFVLLNKKRNRLKKLLLKEGVDVQPLLTFNDLSRKGKISKKIDKEHLIFALYRNKWEIKFICDKIKKVVKGL